MLFLQRMLPRSLLNLGQLFRKSLQTKITYLELSESMIGEKEPLPGTEPGRVISRSVGVVSC